MTVATPKPIPYSPTLHAADETIAPLAAPEAKVVVRELLP